MTIAGGNRIMLAGVVLGAFLNATAPTSAATVKCIEASRYSTLARITGGSLDKLAHGLLGKELHELPPPDACRAVLLSGPIGRGSANELLDAVVKSRGWLAWVYLAASDSDVIEETKIATIMRDFRLSSMTMLSDLDYVADFLTDPLPLPASVSYAWPEAQRATKGQLVERLDDYLQNTQRRITRGTDTCERGCWTIVAGSIDRHEAGLKVLLQGAKAMKPSSPEDKEAAKARAKVRHDFGLDIVPQQRAFGWVSSQPFPRLRTLDPRRGQERLPTPDRVCRRAPIGDRPRCRRLRGT